MILIQKLIVVVFFSAAFSYVANVCADEVNTLAIDTLAKNDETSLATTLAVAGIKNEPAGAIETINISQSDVEPSAQAASVTSNLLSLRSAEKFIQPPSAPQFATSIIKMLGGLAVVVTFIFLVAALARRTGLTQMVKYKKIHLRETIAIGTKERLVLVDFYGQSLLLGVSEGSIALLKTVPQSQNEVTEPTSLGAKTVTDFQQKLNAFLLKGQK